MRDERNSTRLPAAGTMVWLGILVLIVFAGLTVRDADMRRTALRAVLLATAVAEATAGAMYVFRAPRMAERAGRPYAIAYHGVMQDFGFYNLAMALLLVQCALDPAGGIGILWTAMLLYAVHAATHALRYGGWYYGGEAPIPTRRRGLELRDALQLAVALAGMLSFYPAGVH